MMEFLPYREGDDLFEETAGPLKGRLHVDPETGHGIFLPAPTEEALSEFYNGIYIRPYKSFDPERAFTPAVVEVATAVAAHMQKIAGLPPVFRTHDVGCAFGSLTYGFQQIGMNATGNEANKQEVAQGNPYCQNGLSDKPLAVALAESGQPIDLVTALHVFEHFPDPVAALKAVAEHLSPVGVVYICVPNGHSLQAMIGGRRKDPCYNFPGHLQYFTPKSILALLKSAGLDPIQLDTRAILHMEGGYKGAEALLGLPAELMVNASAWSNAALQNLLGYELWALAALPSNTTAQRDPGIFERAETAHKAFLHRSPLERAGATP